METKDIEVLIKKISSSKKALLVKSDDLGEAWVPVSHTHNISYIEDADLLIYDTAQKPVEEGDKAKLTISEWLIEKFEIEEEFEYTFELKQEPILEAPFRKGKDGPDKAYWVRYDSRDINLPISICEVIHKDGKYITLKIPKWLKEDKEL